MKSGKMLMVLLVIGILVSSAQANLLTNNSFESGDFTGWWTWNEDAVNQSGAVVSDTASDGTYSVELVTASGDWGAQVGQEISMAAGTAWDLSFDYIDKAPDWLSLEVSIAYYDGAYNWVGGDYPVVLAAPASTTGWESASYSGVTSPGTEIVNIFFTAYGWGTAGIDNVSLVPEPATMGLMLLGGLVLRRRRKV